ncbi:MAG: tetratricopeptide repeat protein [Saprospiraceae bacterium]|nr:tetratricopeptide repeat protein [Saprospiraceae bacterium]
MKNHLCLFFLLCFAGSIYAQNTIGGVKVLVPEAEVKRQSQFLDAEKERLLAHWDKAISGYKAIVFEYPDNDAAWYGLARSYAASNDWVNAFDAMNKAVEKSPENHWYLIYQAELYEKNGRNKDALETYETLVKRAPQTPEFYEKLAYLALLNEDPKRALKALEKLEQLQGINEKTTAQKHLIFVGMGENKKAAEEYRKLANAHPNEEKYLYQLADFYERINDKNASKKVWAEVLQKFPDDPLARLALAEQSSGSEVQYLASVKPLFEDPKVSIDSKVKELAPFLQKLESGTDAALTQTMIELGGILQKTHPDEAKAWSLSGDILYLAGRNAEALERYKQCIKLNAGVFSVWNNTLSILQDQKNYQEMQSVAEKAIDVFPNQPQAYLFYGIASNALRQHNDALNLLNQAVLMAGNNPTLKADILDQIGEAYLGKGDKEKAKDAWKKAFDLTKNPAFEKKLSTL